MTLVVTLAASNVFSAALSTLSKENIHTNGPTHAFNSIDQSFTQPYTHVIDGELPRGNRLTKPILAWIAPESGIVVVSEPQYHMHGIGDSVQAAIDDFRNIIIDELESLREDRAHLGPQLLSQLAYLDSIISRV